jgi:hypothetical protein
MELILL